MWIPGLAQSHNGAVALIEDGHVRFAVQLERLERRKRHPLRIDEGGPGPGVVRAINYCLAAAGIKFDEIQAVAATTPWTLPAQVSWPAARLRWVPHHLAHAEYALHYSTLEPGLVLIIDAHGTQEVDRARMDIVERRDDSVEAFGGSTETVSAYRFDGKELSLIYRMGGVMNDRFGLLDGSIGQVWELGSSICFGARDQAGKVMGLAAYGRRCLPDELLRLVDGRVSTRLDLLGDPRLPYRDAACEIQTQTTRVLLELLERLSGRVAGQALYYSGGVALNVVTNEQIIRSGRFESVFMNGSCEDNGTAIGAALAVYHEATGQRAPEPITESYGREYSDYEVARQLRRHPVEFEELSPENLIDRASELLVGGKIVGWFQGRSEFGPRALGNRSILASPLGAGTKDRLNGRVKHREGFRPYAAVVPEERTAEYFDLRGPSPVMLREGKVLDAELPAITHVDGTSRIQTVRAPHPLHRLTSRFGERTGKHVLLNTSMNVAGEPIAETPEDAVLTLLRTEIDALFVGGYAVRRK